MNNEPANMVQGNALQGSSSAQQQTGTLQQQQSSQYQQAAGLQQDVLGLESYKSYEGLNVVGQNTVVPADQVTVARSSNDLILVFFILLIALAAFIFYRYNKSLKSSKDSQIATEKLASIQKSAPSPATARSTATKTKKKKKKKPAAKKKKR